MPPRSSGATCSAPGIDEPLVWYEGSGTSDRRWFHADERGSVIAVSDGNGDLVGTRNRYDEYGVPQGALTGRFGYTGQAWLPDVGLYDYRNRIYHPGLGRFMQTDPIGYGGGMNLYAYVGNDPVNLTDPLGLGPDDDDPIVVTAHRVGRGGAGGLGGINSPGGGPTIGANEAAPAVVLPGPPLPGRPSLCLGENAQGGCAQIVVTAQFRADTPFAFDGRRFVLNPYYLKPWYSDYVDVCFAVCPPLIGLAGAAALGIAIFAIRGKEIVGSGWRIAPFWE